MLFKEVQVLVVVVDLVVKLELAHILFEGDHLLQLHTWWLLIK